MSSFLERTVARMENKREAVATELLDWDKITVAIGLASAAGAAKTTMTPAAPIKIKHTAAAIDAETRLKKGGFRPMWTDDRRATDGSIGDQLEIEW